MILGQGSYGKVTVRNGNAIKKFAKLSHLVQEYTALRYLEDTTYTVHALGVNFEELELEMELYDMSLRKWLTERKEHSASMNDIMKIIHDILMGLVEFHDRNLAHGDLKPGNILIQRSPLRAVLGDCGFVSVSKYAKVERTAASYRDPVIDHDYTHDMFSFGICYLELVLGIRVNKQFGYDQIKELIHERVHDYEQKKIIYNLLHEDKRRRPTARDLLYRLFNENPPLWENKINMYINTPGEIRDQRSIKRRFKEIVLQNGVARGKRGYSALLRYLSNNHVACEPIHISVTITILSSLFGPSPLREKDIIMYAEVRSISQVYPLLRDMINDRSFIYILLSP